MTQQQSINPTNWYAIYTKPRTEKKVYNRFVENGYNANLPLQTSIKQWSDRKKKVSTPLIPGYVFVNIDKDRLFDTLRIQGTLGVLRYLGRPAVIKDYEMENLKILMNETDEIAEINEGQVVHGEAVEVVDGPLKGLKGYSANFMGKHRVLVEVEALGSKTLVNVPLGLVKKIKENLVELT